MTTLVLGCGMMGSAIAYDLAKNSAGVTHLIVADLDEQRARSVAESLADGRVTVEPRWLDVGSHEDVVALMRTVDVALGATSYTHNLALTKAAIDARRHFVDLGGNMNVVYQQMVLSEEARAAKVCILPNCGLAPGMACVIAAGAAKKFSRVDEIHIRVGGLPQRPKPPLNYQLVFAPEGLINEYIEPAEIVRNGKRMTVPSMQELETLSFPRPYDTLEAFTTSGGVSTLPQMFEGNVRELDYKTIRYRGHCEKFTTLLDLGFASSEPIVVGNSVRTARELFEELLRRKLPFSGPDVVLVRVTVSGILDNSQTTLAYEMVDVYDTASRLTAMMRTTAFPTSIIAQMIVEGSIEARGVMPPEQCVPLEPFMDELRTRNILFTETRTAS